MKFNLQEGMTLQESIRLEDFINSNPSLEDCIKIISELNEKDSEIFIDNVFNVVSLIEEELYPSGDFCDKLDQYASTLSKKEREEFFNKGGF